MIDRLVDYALNQGLATEPGFKEKTVKWAVDVTDGRYTGLLLLGDPKAKGLPFACCPDLSQPELVALGGTASHFLVASCDQVALFGAADPDKPENKKTHEKHAFFVKLLREASEAVPDLAQAANVLDDGTCLGRLQEDLREQKARPTDLITLRINGRLVVEQNVWHDWWRQYRANIPRKGGSRGGRTMVCLATGQLVEPASTHPKVTGLSDVGGQASGSALVSYDKDAFPSYRLKQSENGAMSEETASAYRAGLNKLLATNSRKLAGAKVVYWYQRPVPPDIDVVDWLDEPPEDPNEQEALARQEVSAAQQRAGDLLDALRTGKRPDLLGNRYYALTLSGSGGRVMVRDWMEGAFEDLVAHIHAWFDDLTIVRRDGGGLAPAPKLLAVIASTARDLKDVPAPHAAQLWQAAVACRPIPRQLMALALARVRIAIIKDEAISHAGIGLLKAYHIRKGETMSPYLNEEHPDPAYHCGRLMAILARVQYAALGDVGAGLVQRYYAAASTTPALVLGRLTRTSQFHLNKLEPRLASWFDGRLADIWSCIRDRVPTVLTLEQQSLFALGYYQQMAADRAGKGDKTQTPAASQEPGEAAADAAALSNN